MKDALFLNGVYSNVLEEIIKAQKNNRELVCYLQPYRGQSINLLRKEKPSVFNPILLYISPTSMLNIVEYTGQIVGWEDKRIIKTNKERIAFLNSHIKKYQPNEKEIYFYSDKEKSKICVNLLSVKNLKKLSNPFSVRNLIKQSDSKPFKPRYQAGYWSRVTPVPEWIDTKDSHFFEQFEDELNEEISKSLESSRDARAERIRNASKEPKKVQVVTKGYQRNPDIIAEVLLRANGICERCKSKAPFIKKKRWNALSRDPP